MALALNSVKYLQTEKATKGFSLEAIPADSYDGVISSLVDLGIQTREYEGVIKNEHQIKVIFEIPAITFTNQEGEELPRMLSMDMKISAHEKSKFFTLVKAAMRTELEPEEVEQIIRTDKALDELLGKTVVLEVNQFKTRHGTTNNGIKAIAALHKKVPPSDAVRDTFRFETMNPDIEIFKTKLNRFTRDKIMSAVNSDEFPKELQLAYKQVQEEEARKAAERAANNKSSSDGLLV